MEEEVTPTPSAAELMALSERATQGEWQARPLTNGTWAIDGFGPTRWYGLASVISHVDNVDDDNGEGQESPEGVANAQFIAGLVNWFRANASTLTTPQPADGVTDEMKQAAAKVVQGYMTGDDSSPSVKFLHIADDILRAALKAAPPTPTAPATDAEAVAWAMTDYQSDGPMTLLTNDAAQAKFYAESGLQVVPLYATPAATDAVRDWISVSDGLPNDDELVIAYGNGGFGGSPQLSTCWFRAGTGQFSDYGVTHWQSLPKPPTDSAKFPPETKGGG